MSSVFPYTSHEREIIRKAVLSADTIMEMLVTYTADTLSTAQNTYSDDIILCTLCQIILTPHSEKRTRQSICNALLAEASASVIWNDPETT